MNNRSVIAFQSIYATHEWKGGSLSGPGSDPERTLEFRNFLENFIESKNIRSIVDFGCGDWTYAKLMDWKGAHYIGIDVVDTVVQRNRELYESARVQFLLRQSLDAPMPQAELFVAKDVLQHLPTEDVHKVLAIASSYQYCIFVNDISHQRRRSWRHAWRWKDFCDVNVDIEPGGYRLLSLRDAPFYLDARIEFTYLNRYRDMRWTKQVLVVDRSENRGSVSGDAPLSPCV